MKHFTLTALFCILLLSLVSCETSNHRNLTKEKAKQLILYADSLRYQGELYTDTAALITAIEVLSTNNLNSSDREIICSAYFLLGRNYDVLHMDTKEVPCFIYCIENSKDTKILFSSYTHLREICVHQKEYDIAEYIAKQMQSLSSESTFKSQYANLALARIYVLNNKLDDAFDILNSFNSYGDSLLLSSFVETKITYFIAKEYLDSAECYATYYLSLPSIRLSVDTTYKYIYLSNIYYGFKNYYLSGFYADMASNGVLSYVDSVNVAETYLSLFNATNDTIYLIKYSNYCSSQNSLLGKPAAEEAKAAEMIKHYVANKTTISHRLLFIIIVVILFIVFFVIVYIYKIKLSKLHKTNSGNLEKIGSLKQSVDSLNDKLSSISKAETFPKTEKCKIINSKITEYNDTQVWNSPVWKNSKFIATINTDFFNIGYKLKTNYGLSDNDVKLSILILCGCHRSIISEALFISINSVEKTKSRLAVKLGVRASEIRDFLIDVMCS